MRFHLLAWAGAILVRGVRRPMPPYYFPNLFGCGGIDAARPHTTRPAYRQN